MELQRADQGPGPVPPRRMHDHAGRLVDDHQLLVFVKDVQGDVFRTGRLAGDFGQDHGDPLAFTQAAGGFAAAAVHLGPAGRDDPPQMPPAIVLKVNGQERVQPLVCFGRSDHQLDGHGGERRSGGFFHARDAATRLVPRAATTSSAPKASPARRNRSIPSRPPPI